jgi:Na+/H+-dicarboxylate symporter
MKKTGLTAWIIIAMTAGIITGLLVILIPAMSGWFSFQRHVHSDRYFPSPD